MSPMYKPKYQKKKKINQIKRSERGKKNLKLTSPEIQSDAHLTSAAWVARDLGEKNLGNASPKLRATQAQVMRDLGSMHLGEKNLSNVPPRPCVA